MKATIVRQLTLPNLPSASGIEVLDEVAYIIGDDSPLLYRLDAATLQPMAPIVLFETDQFATGRIPKHLKPDLECLTAAADADGAQGLLILGSGATTAREIGFWVDLPAAGNQVPEVHPLSLTVVYEALRGAMKPGLVLNLEAAAATATELLLLQRSVGTEAGNVLYLCDLYGALDLLRHRTHVVPSFRALEYTLPAIDGIPAGFSGATTFENSLFLTASVENTPDAVADGVVLGSFVGVIDFSKGQLGPTARFAQLALANGQAYWGKVESVAVRRRLGTHRYELLLVTDDDAGGSTALLVELSLN
ncbi:hypothetical protein F0P96_00125 [Hymenobacter busanensis]|uniref:Uncharacterized protein n=1 Tax=Hymenobacter busanensis TaxID=2607656 RepID=A0A7L4ZVU7_9BACT|nr:hypothetical protein [Hymenobacter busanensis]KAA9339081.1 hypothetical protein F0P96_00125 [Hymenobacter busanensis]QHJ07157.1 hypothetical protein GUY19_07625 [Hymenobacter busanensis]